MEMSAEAPGAGLPTSALHGVGVSSSVAVVVGGDSVGHGNVEGNVSQLPAAAAAAAAADPAAQVHVNGVAVSSSQQVHSKDAILDLASRSNDGVATAAAPAPSLAAAPAPAPAPAPTPPPPREPTVLEKIQDKQERLAFAEAHAALSGVPSRVAQLLAQIGALDAEFAEKREKLKEVCPRLCIAGVPQLVSRGH